MDVEFFFGSFLFEDFGSKLSNFSEGKTSAHPGAAIFSSRNREKVGNALHFSSSVHSHVN